MIRINKQEDYKRQYERELLFQVPYVIKQVRKSSLTHYFPLKFVNNLTSYFIEHAGKRTIGGVILSCHTHTVFKCWNSSYFTFDFLLLKFIYD